MTVPSLRNAALATTAVAWLVVLSPAQDLAPWDGVAGTYRHRPRGALASGTGSVTLVGRAYRFRFVGDETIEYVVDMDHASVRNGMLRVQEVALSGGVEPLVQGGLQWRNDDGDLESPATHASNSDVLLIHEHLDEASGVLTLRYRETRKVTKKVGVKTYRFWLQGKVLRVRAFADAAANDAYLDNYGGIRPGCSRNAPQARDIHVPFMDSVPVVTFRNGAETLFYSSFLDFYRSNGSEIGLQKDDCGYGDGIELFFAPTYYSDVNGRIVAPVDETLNLIVTGDIGETFPVIQHEKSPHYDLLADRMIFNAPRSAPRSWIIYGQHFQALSAWGVDNLGGYVFAWEKYGLNLFEPDRDQAGLVGCDPALFTVGTMKNGVFRIDPNDAYYRQLVDQTFASMMSTIRGRGYLVGLYQTPGNSVDQQGYGPYYDKGPVQGPYPGSPLRFPSWKLPDGTPFGLILPAVNTPYRQWAPYVTRDSSGEPKYGWDTTLNLVNSSWEGRGHKVHVVSPRQRYDLLRATNGRANDEYRPNAMFIDAVTDVPNWVHIDQSADPELTKTIWRALRQSQDDIARYKRERGGPLWGENHAWRYRQWDSFESGLWDGRHRGFSVSLTPSTGDPKDPNFDDWVIPDYELREVLPKASSHHGMGWEANHMDLDELANGGGCKFPVDCQHGEQNEFFDSWWTNIVTYGHSAFFATNGHVPNVHRTMEGILREYYLISGLQKVYRRGSLVGVGYEHHGSFLTLSQAIGSGVDLENPRVQIEYADGPRRLTIFANHDVANGGTWRVTVDDWPPGAANPESFPMDLPPNGFVAFDGRGLLVFSAYHPDLSPLGNFVRIDYARIPGQWEMISTRRSVGQGAPLTYGGFPTQSILDQLDALDNSADKSAYENMLNGTIVRNDVHDRIVAAHGGLWNANTDDWKWPDERVWVIDNGAPAPVSLSLVPQDGQTELGLGQQLGVNAILDLGADANGDPITRNVTPLSAWSIAAGSAVIVNHNGPGGVVEGVSLGPSTVHAAYDPDGAGPADPLTATLVVTVVADAPTASATVTGSPQTGAPLTFDGRASTHPRGGPLSYRWSFGDGSPDEAGAVVRHAYHEAGTHTAELTVTDRDGDTSSGQVRLLVTGELTDLWVDGFDDGRLDGWVSDPTGAWGVLQGSLAQTDPSGQQQAGVDQAFPDELRVVAEVTVAGAAGAHSAGVHLKKAAAGDGPGESGCYAAFLFDGAPDRLEARHSNNAIDVIVNGTTLFRYDDPSPQSGSYVGLATDSTSATFDGFRVRRP